MSLAPPTVAVPEAVLAPRTYARGQDLEALFRPLTVRGVTLPNRVVVPAMETNLAGRDGGVTPRLVDYYVERARGEAGYVTVENTSVHPSGMVTDRMLRLDHDGLTGGFRELVDAVHAAGGRIVVQLSHAGRQTLSDYAGGQPVAPSAIPCPVMKELPRALSRAEIADLVAAFGAAARRAAEAGADGVELHMAHGYLLCGFLSPYSNVREDEYGGSVAGRARFPAEVVRAVREALGGERMVIARISADEKVEGGIEPGEAVEIGRHLVEAGVDLLHVSACNYESMFWNMPSYFLPEGVFEPLAARLRGALGVPVIAVGRIHRPEAAAAAVARGHADLVAMGRATIADPHLPRKARLGLPIRPCLACNRCIASISGGNLECTVNPEVGAEGRRRWAASRELPGRGRRILIAGAGPAGLSAAAAAADAGFDVTLAEARGELGGQLDIAALPPHKEPVGWYRDYLVAEVRARPVRVLAGRALDAALLAEVSPDALVLATGSRPRLPASLDTGALPVVDADRAMREPGAVGPRPVVLGGGAGGCEVAHHLAALGCSVTVLEKKRKVATDLNPPVRFHMERALRDGGVRILTQVRDVRVEGADVVVQWGRDGDARIMGATALVAAIGREPVGPDPASLEGFSGTVVAIGDADRPRSIFEAVADAVRVIGRIAGER